MKKTILVAACAAFLAGSAFAQTAAPVGPVNPAGIGLPSKPQMAAPKPGEVSNQPTRANGPPPAPMVQQHSAKSLDCSKQADAQGLHGKKRKAFRDACKKG